MTRRGRLAALTAALAALAAPGLAHAGYGVQPIGQTIPVATSSTGSVASPQGIDLLVYLDERDSEPFVWVSDSPAVGPFGMPAGSTVAACNATSLQPWPERGKYVCAASTAGMRPGRTYYWWLDYRRHEDGSATSQQAISGPFPFSLVEAIPPVTPPEAEPNTPVARASTKTWQSAATLPTRDRYTGDVSIKHARLTDVVYETMKAFGRPRVLAIGCWTEPDFEAVARSADFDVHDGDTSVAGFWLGRQPRWLHLAPQVCGWIQELLDTRRPSARRAFGLTVALHETLHAYGIRNEAQTNCYAVQLVPFAARRAGLSAGSADYLRTLAINSTRRTAPPGYWNGNRCRDGGPWDLLPKRVNLR